MHGLSLTQGRHEAYLALEALTEFSESGELWFRGGTLWPPMGPAPVRIASGCDLRAHDRSGTSRRAVQSSGEEIACEC